jgi:hypothetical protein
MTPDSHSGDRVDAFDTDANGTGRAVVNETADGPGEARLPTITGDGWLKATGLWFDDEPPIVELVADLNGVQIRLSLSPKQARRFGADLRTAATHAEQGSAELTE